MLLEIESRKRPQGRRLPNWLKVPAPGNAGYRKLKRLAGELKLNTVCQSAMCPNIGECWGHGTATFMILGDVCTRSCGFCAIKTGRPEAPDREEPERVARAVAALGLTHAVITSVNRDELADGGAGIFAETIRVVHALCPETSVEVLIPDFQGDHEALGQVLAAGPQILNHNVETVPRLYKLMRPQARYDRSLELLKASKGIRNDIPTKSGIMIGAGETVEEVRETVADIASQGTDILTIGQYLQPSPTHVPVDRFCPPEEFRSLEAYARELGFIHVESGPLVRSSYHAADQVVRA